MRATSDPVTCTFCSREETRIRDGRRETWRHEKDVSAFVCSTCTQKLLRATQEQLREGYRMAIEKGYSEKAAALHNYIEDNKEALHVKTGKARSNMVRTRSVRKARSARERF